MNTSPVERDERTDAIENAGYRLAYILMSFGLLVDVMYRGRVHHEAAWDLFALVVLSGAVGKAYQGSQNALPQSLVVKGLLLAAVAACVGAAITLLWR